MCECVKTLIIASMAILTIKRQSENFIITCMVILTIKRQRKDVKDLYFLPSKDGQIEKTFSLNESKLKMSLFQSQRKKCLIISISNSRNIVEQLKVEPKNEEKESAEISLWNKVVEHATYSLETCSRDQRLSENSSDFRS